ncbi:MAG TPA: suppressor of fused domain protein [Frankiaceae bacterium]|jgi:hypothetical protein
MISTAEVFAGLRAHLDAFWPDRSHEEFVWSRGPIGTSLPRFRVRRIAPAIPSEPWVYVTVGAWEATGSDAHGTEFLLLSPVEEPLHVELLAMVANLHADARYRLHVGSTITIGRPWIDSSLADHLLVSLPYPYGPALEHCRLAERHLQLLWLVPITPAEAGIVEKQGLGALEPLLDQPGVDVLAPTRRSVG